MAENVGYATLTVIPSMKGFSSALNGQLGPQMSGISSRAGVTSGGKFRAGFLAQAKGIVGPLGAIVGGAAIVGVFTDFIGEAREAEKIGRTTEQLIRSTGGAANLTAADVGNLAGRLSDYAAVDDEVVQSAENVLLTFKNVRTEIGKGNDIFARAQTAALDLSAVLGTDLNSATLQIGKALNDPIKGVTALSRAGVQFTEQQKNQIQALVDSNRLLDAQKVILGELESQVGGAAGAQADAFDKLGVTVANLKEAIGVELLPAMENLATFTDSTLIPGLKDTAGFLGDVGGAVGDLPDGMLQATLSFGALWFAMSKLGGGAGIIRGVTSSVETLQLKGMLAADAVKGIGTQTAALRGGAALTGLALTMADFTNETDRASQTVDSFVSIAGGALMGFAAGGPIGAAIGGGVAAIGSLVQAFKRQDDATQRIADGADQYVATLDAETGAITKNTEAMIANRLEKDGTLEDLQKLGISSATFVDAIAGQSDAAALLGTRLDELRTRFTGVKNEIVLLGEGANVSEGSLLSNIESVGSARDKYGDLLPVLERVEEAYGLESTALDEAERSKQRVTDATRQEGEATETTTRAIRDQSNQVNRLINAHNRLVESFITAKQGQIGLEQAIDDAAEEARKGAATLDINTQAGRDNYNALLDVAQGWNDLPGRMQGAKGALREQRQTFIDLAESMGASTRQAERLADKLLDLPTRKQVKVDVQFEVADDPTSRFLLGGRMKVPGLATGGKVGGYGMGDTQLRLLDPREWVINPQAVSYYGDSLLHALNRMQIPKMAAGGPVSGPPPSRPVQTTGLGMTINIGQVVSHSPRQFSRQMQDEGRKRRAGGINL